MLRCAPAGHRVFQEVQLRSQEAARIWGHAFAEGAEACQSRVPQESCCCSKPEAGELQSVCMVISILPIGPLQLASLICQSLSTYDSKVWNASWSNCRETIMRSFLRCGFCQTASCESEWSINRHELISLQLQDLDERQTYILIWHWTQSRGMDIGPEGLMEEDFKDLQEFYFSERLELVVCLELILQLDSGAHRLVKCFVPQRLQILSGSDQSHELAEMRSLLGNGKAHAYPSITGDGRFYCPLSLLGGKLSEYSIWHFMEYVMQSYKSRSHQREQAQIWVVSEKDLSLRVVFSCMVSP